MEEASEPRVRVERWLLVRDLASGKVRRMVRTDLPEYVLQPKLS